MHLTTRGLLANSRKWLALTLLCAFTASCSTTKDTAEKPKRSKEYFAESVYGVKASPRVVASGPIPKGGGRYMVGKPYVVKGKTFVPKENPRYDKVGVASWYGDAFHGRLTANGELYDKEHLSAAHPTLPLPSYARVTNLNTGSSVIVRINDRGPFHKGRIIDLSRKTADMLDMKHSGTGEVRVQYIGPARMDGHDMPYLMASYIRKGERGPVIDPGGQIASGVMVASNETNTPDYQPPVATTYQTALAGPTPSGNTTPQTLDAQLLMQAGTAAPGAVVSGESFAALPDFGPMPMARPHHIDGYDGSGYAAAYAQERPEAGALAFEAILVRNDGLTERSILASVAKGGITLSSGR
ncbi:MAG: septal ring lytic transglycosylase RlpA family protein [Alphaproteobacteria bacterium]|nr:septal ring lytic transglycosylase RlpA family protein [Alphaproteobacteria bacterium]MBU0835162.1 septal ring lytic transglycosylase RlpA family protein [Alphaproteobacteria bacterium]MBU1762706.1 septal ring lytic transglycosylase RlpA family protein [Alphaproteobacteria bacterium]MDZ7876004.1 septal ring lytic transglycosylase RlpA family protein [Rhizobium sp.]